MGNERCVKMHDLVRDMALRITTGKTSILGKSWCKINGATKCAGMEQGPGEGFIDGELGVTTSLAFANVTTKVSDPYNIFIV
ncbi:hypothetical protein PVK06_033750 [Gossypium arboreum]|uniref:Uncharacterized protein n=1 Tax=Gossypium arboreum TaxID=29729 RepID=A0ABR0NCA8_GOSAR|nr:hypothetical protein PVK06_033750 [Gossypium arboreum]